MLLKNMNTVNELKIISRRMAAGLHLIVQWMRGAKHCCRVCFVKKFISKWEHQWNQGIEMNKKKSIVLLNFIFYYFILLCNYVIFF
jgi:hypothetical protein